jgi:carbamoyl-phosphate synthase large subunit
MVNVLVMSAGAAPAVAVINALRLQKEIEVRIISADANPLSSGFYLSDAYYVVPKLEEQHFIPTIVNICEEEKIKVIFPILDEELLIFAEKKEFFKEKGIVVAVNDAHVVTIGNDKYKTYRFCLEKGILTPKTYLPHQLREIKEIDYPLFIKPRFGRGSIGAFKVKNEEELEFFLKYVEEPIIQEYIPGKEYTIDMLCDFESRVICVVPRERIETKAGQSYKGKTVKDEKLILYGKDIAEKFGLKSGVNIQCIVYEGKYYLIEVNPKFAAAVPLTIAAGANTPSLLLRICLGEKISPRIGEFKENLYMLRHWKEIFVEEERIKWNR